MPVAASPPSRFAAGDTLRFAFAHADFPATDGWALAFRLVGVGIALDIAAAADGAGFIASATAAATAGLTIAAPGVPATLYGYASKAGERFPVYEAACFVSPNPASATGDLRSVAAKALDAIGAVLAGKASRDQASYKIGDRELQRIPVPELLALRDDFRRQVGAETQAARIAAGRPRVDAVFARFGRG